MGGRSNAYKNSILTSLLNGGGNLYIRLYTTASTVSDSALGTEATFGGYPTKGLAVVANSTNWVVSANVANNGVVITFPDATSAGETLRYFAIWKNNTSALEADRLYWGQLTEDKAVVTGKAISFLVNSITITEN